MQRELQLQLLDLKQQHAKLEHDVERCRDALEPPSADTGMGPSSMARCVVLSLRRQAACHELAIRRCTDCMCDRCYFQHIGACNAPASRPTCGVWCRLRQERDALLRQLQKLKLESEEEEAKCDSFSSVMTEHFDGEQAGVRAAQQRLVKVGSLRPAAEAVCGKTSTDGII